MLFGNVQGTVLGAGNKIEEQGIQGPCSQWSFHVKYDFFHVIV